VVSIVVRAIVLLFRGVISGDVAGGRAAGLQFGVDVTAAPQQRRDRGQRGQARRHGEHHGQTVMERRGDQLREEPAAGEDPLGGRGQGGQHPGRGEQVLDLVHPQHRREQRRHRRQRPGVHGHTVRHAVADQAAGQRLGQAAGQPGDHE